MGQSYSNTSGGHSLRKWRTPNCEEIRGCTTERPESNLNKRVFVSKGRKREREGERINEAQAEAGGWWKKEEEEEGGIAKCAPSVRFFPVAGWQRLNDLPNNKSSRRYDRTLREPSLGTSKLLTSAVAVERNDSLGSILFLRDDASPQCYEPRPAPLVLDTRRFFTNLLQIIHTFCTDIHFIK